MKTALAFLLASLLAGCAIPMSKQVHWQRASLEELKKLCPDADNPVGCAVWTKNSNDCYIYTLAALEPNSSKEQWVIGHELLHCYNGKYHK
jgi:hypothetical protein